MNAPGRVLILGMLAALAACARRDEAPTAYDAASTYGFLQKVGRVRSLINADNKERIPAMIRGRDEMMLSAEGAKTEEYKRSLAGLGSVGVDPDALTFARNFGAILDSYRDVCVDSAELFRELRASNARPPAQAPAPPTIRIGAEANPNDTIGTVDALLESMDRMDAGAKSGAISLQPIVDKVREDRDRLRSAKIAHHDFTVKLKAALARRYPGRDWGAKEILP